MFLVTLVVVMILIVVAVKRVEIEEKMEVNQAKIMLLNGQIADEEARSEEIKQYEKYTQTKAFNLFFPIPAARLLPFTA